MQDSSLYILPSSVHEVIMFPAKGDEDDAALRKMVRDINDTEVEKQDRLSDNIYFYNHETDMIELKVS